MGCPTQCILGQNLTFTVQANAGTGAPSDATGSVAYKVYEDETSTAILSGTMSKLASKTGYYSEQIATTAANGFERYKSYQVRVTATVDGVAVAKSYTFLCLGVEDSPTATSGALTSTANFKSYAGITHTDDDTLIGYLISRATDEIEKFCDRILRSDEFRERVDGDGSHEIILKQWPITTVDMISTTATPFRIINTDSNAYNASVTIADDSSDASVSGTMTLVISGGANAGSDELTLSSYNLTELAAAIIALGKGWSATVDPGYETWEATELLTVSGLGCLDNYVYVQLPYQPYKQYTIRKDEGIIESSSIFPRGRSNIIVRYTAGYVTTPAGLEQICIDLTAIYYRSRKRDLSAQREKLGDHDITSFEARGIPDIIGKRLVPFKKMRF